ncbi:vesicle transport protein USE1 [Prorops nasuta]|uniref:vesicle transport protein USE1 n=1 Tax=Prorops nasuta TaxID=863751 RepID=UPI0034CE6CD0
MWEMSRLEVNIRRLLTKCELIAKDDPQKDWKLEKYVLALDDMLKELQTLPNKPSKDVMTGYIKRVDFLKGFLSTTKLKNPVEKVIAAQMLSKSFLNSDGSIAPNIATQIHQRTTAKCNKELRDELFNCDKDISNTAIRQRKLTNDTHNDDVQALLTYNRNIQEKVAENMILMTSNMKEHALAASAVIKKDINSLEKSDKLSDINVNKLKSESLKLEEHTKSNWRCWLWLMIAFVLVVFFNMVLFMKVAKKKV